MIRVLFVQGAGHRAGAEGILLGLVRNLPAFEVSPSVAFLADGPFIDEVAAAGADVYRVPASGRVRSVWEIRRVSRALADVVGRSSTDVVQANGEKMAIYAGRAARRAGRPCVFRLHDSPFDSPSSFMVQLLMRTTPHDAVVTGSAWMADAFNRRWRIGARPIRNGVDLDRLPEVATDVVGEFGWEPGTVVLGFFGRLQQWKGVDVFLRAVAEVSRAHPEVAALVVGGALYGREERYAAELPELARQLGIAERVRFTGHRDDALALMAGCDVVVHASRRPEPLGMVVPEAMGLGRAIVASRTRGPEEVISDHETGLLVPPGDVASLSSALTELVASPETRRTLAAAGKASVERDWSARRMASEFADLYRQLSLGS